MKKLTYSVVACCVLRQVAKKGFQSKASEELCDSTNTL